MSGRGVKLVAAFAMLCMISCAPPEPVQEAEPEAPEEASAETADPVELDPDHYAEDFENERVRIIRIAYGAGEESVMHHHPDSVAVFLTDYRVQMTLPDGSTEELSGEAGEAIFVPAGEHMPQNLSDEPLELVQVELMASEAGESTGGPDPTEVDADHYTAEFENDQVRIVRIAYDAGEASVMHHHPDSVAVFLTDHLVEMTMPDGSTQEIAAAAGDTLFIPAGDHLPKNVADEAWELVLVEIP